jgi:hypothetical protein
MKVNVLGLLFAAQRLENAAVKLQALKPPAVAPLAADGTSVGAAGRLETAATALWSSVTAQAASLHSAALHLQMIAAKFGTQEEINKAHLDYLAIQVGPLDVGTLTALEPVPPLPPDVRVPLPPVPPLTGEVFSQQIHNGSASRGSDFSTTATENGSALDAAASTVREVMATVPEQWDSPVGTEALAGRLNEYVANLTAMSDRFFELGGEGRRHADDYSETAAATPKPQEFKDNLDAYNRAVAAGDPIGASQLAFARGQLEQRALAEAARYAGVTETTTAPKGAGTPPQVPAGAGAAGAGAAGAAAGAAPVGRSAAAPQQAQVAKAGAADAAQAGEGAGQLAQMLPSALGAIGGMAGGMAGMAGQVPQALMQTGQGLAQAATQGVSQLASKKPTEAGLSDSVGDLRHDELTKAKGGSGAGGAGGGATHPAGSLGPPVTPSTSHTPPAMPSGGPPPTTTPAAAGGTAMGGMGMPMGGIMPHGQGGAGDGSAKVPADKKVVTPPQPHTEAVTGRVADRTAAAAEASRARTESDADDDPPPRGPVLRRITLAPLNDDRT